ncbi:unnamed protein product [Caenorhabditis brenneri]
MARFRLDTTTSLCYQQQYQWRIEDKKGMQWKMITSSKNGKYSEVGCQLDHGNAWLKENVWKTNISASESTPHGTSTPVTNYHFPCSDRLPDTTDNNSVFKSSYRPHLVGSAYHVLWET